MSIASPKWVLAQIAAALLSSATAIQALEPANPNANPRARGLLKYLGDLELRAEKRVISGQFINYGKRIEAGLLKEIHAKTGHWPAMMGIDYADYSTIGLHTQTGNKVAIEYWNSGGLVTVGVHLYNPVNTNDYGLRDKGVDMKVLLEAGTLAHRRWMQELDTLAEGLRELKAAGVPVLWRPFHEMNGGWFWWGAQEPETFKKVWRHMFDYFTYTNQLDNLLWVYGPNHGSKPAAYYPGDKYVDIVGLDAYTDHIDPEHIRGYPEMDALPKPFGFTEYGPHGAQNPPGDYDYTRFIAGIQRHFSSTVFFMSWNGKWSLARNNNVKELLEHPWIINREDLPRSLFQ